MPDAASKERRGNDPANSRTKRVFDVCAGGLALIVASPLLLLAAIAVRVADGSPVLFKHQRAGYRGKSFTLLKLRTMRGQLTPGHEGIDDAQRLTKVGRLLRRTSLDELPQLINVLLGDMSLVGPRPLLLEYVPLYSPAQRQRHDARPGLTGLAQASGRNAVSWDDKLALDVWYVNNWTFRLDLEIIARTIGAIISGRGVTAAGEATTTRFTGSKGSGSAKAGRLMSPHEQESSARRRDGQDGGVRQT